MSNFDNTNRGALFKNHRQRPDKNDPQSGGTLNVEGVEYWISGWSMNANGDFYTDKNGDKFLSLAVQRKEDQPTKELSDKVRADSQAPLTGATEPDPNDEIPF